MIYSEENEKNTDSGLEYEDSKENAKYSKYFSMNPTGVLNYVKSDNIYVPAGQNSIIYTPETAAKNNLNNSSQNNATCANSTTTVKVVEKFDDYSFNAMNKINRINFNKRLILILVLILILILLLILILIL